jgi:spore coat protein A
MLKKLWLIGVLVLVLSSGGYCFIGGVKSFQVTQTPLLGSSVIKYSHALPVFGPAGPNPRVAASSALAVSYQEFQQKVLPDAFYATLSPSITPYPGITINPQLGSYVWGYQVGGAPASYPGFTVEAQKGAPTQVTYTNNLGTATSFPILQKYLTVDQTIMWANPYGWMGSFTPYTGPQPAVPHLHGGEVRSDSDGGPEAWWTPGAEGYRSSTLPSGTFRGPAYYNNVYNYPNQQEAATIWFHDHAMGETRLNVYAGLAAFWFIRDSFDTGTPGTGLNLPAGPYEVEMALQDRQFDTNGQLFFPDGYPAGAGLNGDPPNPTVHPYWVPEFFGDVIVVNGRSWPYLQVEPRRYRFRLLDGSNARVYEIRLEDLVTPATGPPIYIIGSDGGLLDRPAITSSTPTNRLVIAPGERYDVIIDFSAFTGQILTLMNTANAPFPAGGIVPDPATTAEIMQFQVTLPLAGSDTSFDPAAPGATLRGGGGQPPAIVRLSDGVGGIDPAVMVNKKRQLILREVTGPGGPLEVLVNNTKYTGVREGTANPIPDSNKVGTNWLTEMPQLGSTEEWEIINTTIDAHPIHLHLVQFQVVNRQAFNTGNYAAAYDAAFPGGLAIDGYGPPMNYNSTGTPGNPNYTGFYGGNPDVTPQLTGLITPPLLHETGWKDTVISYPGEVTRIVARWAPQDFPVAGVTAGRNLFSFNPTIGPGYVWHCHIIDHEDNEMMRPYIPTKLANNTFAIDAPEISAINFLLLTDP